MYRVWLISSCYGIMWYVKSFLIRFESHWNYFNFEYFSVLKMVKLQSKDLLKCLACYMFATKTLHNEVVVAEYLVKLNYKSSQSSG